MRQELLTYIERNSRVDLKELSVILGTDEVTIANELADMEKEHIICGYHTIIDWDKTSADKVTALIEVKVTPQRGDGFDKVAEELCKYPEVNTMYLMSGTYDFLIVLEGKTLRDASMFVSEKLSTVDCVISTATHFILKKYKYHGTIMNKNKVDERQGLML